MTNQIKRKLPVLIATAVISMALVSMPAKADHGNNIIAPVATILAVGWLLNNRQKHYSYSSTRSYHGHKHQRKAKRRHSYSQGGYHRSKRRQHHNW